MSSICSCVGKEISTELLTTFAVLTQQKILKEFIKADLFTALLLILYCLALIWIISTLAWTFL